MKKLKMKGQVQNMKTKKWAKKMTAYSFWLHDDSDNDGGGNRELGGDDDGYNFYF